MFDKNPISGEYTIIVEADKKKKGEVIHPYGRIVAIADVYDALVSRRCYKEPWDEKEVIETIKNERGKQFDPEMVDCFFDIYDVIQNIRKNYNK